MNSALAPHIRRLWLAGADTDAIARALGLSRGAVAPNLQELSDAELAEGVRAHLEALTLAKKPPKGGRSADA
jgi:hypothetical protein